MRERGVWRRAALVGLVASCWVTLSASACQRSGEPKPDPKPDVSAEPGADAGGLAGKPDGVELPEDGSIAPEDVGPKAPALFMIGGMKGYIEPCGCTADILMGGIDRMIGYVESARSFYPATALIAAGDLLFEEPEIEEHRAEQERRKATLLMRAHKRLGTRLTVPGRNDMAFGVTYYLEKMAEGGIEPMGANVTLGGKKLRGHEVFELDGVKVAVVPVVDPAIFEGVEGVEATDASAAVGAELKKIGGVDVTVALVQGELAVAKGLLEAHPTIDFAQVGVKPRETDQIYEVGEAGHTLEVFDQGRYLGILKLYGKGARPEEGGLVNARPVSASELEAIDERVANINATIKKLPPAAPGEEPPLLKKMREQLAELAAERARIKNAKVDVPEDRPSFIWRVIGMKPGFPVDAEIKQAREAYNKSLKDIVPDLPIPEPVAGQPYYVGSNQCASCHAPAHAFWQKTNHGHAIQTLIDRDKQYDQSCVGCHVVGYEKPGGSVVGKLSYAHTLENGMEITKELANVGCEVCHGPGSAHVVAAYTGKDPKPHIERDVDESLCAGSCHVPEHSPRFDYPIYRQQILGPGHGK